LNNERFLYTAKALIIYTWLKKRKIP